MIAVKEGLAAPCHMQLVSTAGFECTSPEKRRRVRKGNKTEVCDAPKLYALLLT